MEGTDLHYLNLLAREFPTPRAVCAEIINLNAILNLPKGTEHFMSDIHGENEAFLHILNNAAGAVHEKVDFVFENTLSLRERRSLCALIYYPREKLTAIRETTPDLDDWYRVTLYRLIQIVRSSSAKFSRSKVRKALPADFAYIMEELINTHDLVNKEKYYENIISAIIQTGSAEALIIEMCTLIKRILVDVLHIVGDVFDRGPHADIILDHLMKHHNVDIQWGNHDVLWMGAAAGSRVCVAVAIKNCIQYDNMAMLETGYGINLLPLAIFAQEVYGDAEVFKPRKLPNERFKPKDYTLYSRMHKAICVIQFKLEGQLVQRRPELLMQDRDMLSRVNWQDGTIELDGKVYPLRDTDFPTIDPLDPNRLTPEEEALIEQLTDSFTMSEKLQAHVEFLYSVGAVYKFYNGNLLFHGCLPLNADGSYMEFEFEGRSYSGRHLMNYCNRTARKGYFEPEGSAEREWGRDFLWYLWCGRNSPIFGRDRITTFERTLVEDAATHPEPKNAYFKYRETEEFCKRLLLEFGLDKPWSLIVNGHIPVKVKDGEDPRKANGRLVVIDGGFCRAYQKQTGIAGYTMFFNSYGLRLAAHEPFTTLEDAINNETDISSHIFLVENLSQRVLVGDMDNGEDIKNQINELEQLLNAYREGLIVPKS